MIKIIFSFYLLIFNCINFIIYIFVSLVGKDEFLKVFEEIVDYCMNGNYMRVNFYDVKKVVKNILLFVRFVDLIKLRLDVKNKLCLFIWFIFVVVKKFEIYMNIVFIKFLEVSLFEFCYRYKNLIIFYVKCWIEGIVFGIFFRLVVFVFVWIDLFDKFFCILLGDLVLKLNCFLFCFIFVNLVLLFLVMLLCY